MRASSVGATQDEWIQPQIKPSQLEKEAHANPASWGKQKIQLDRDPHKPSQLEKTQKPSQLEKTRKSSQPKTMPSEEAVF